MQPTFNLRREKNDRLVCYEYQNDHCFLQFHSQIEIYIVDDGEMEMFVDGKRRTLKKGEMSVALSYVPHDYKTREYSRSSAILIPPHLCREFVAQVSDKRLASPYITDPHVYETVKQCFEALRADGTNGICQLGYLYVILGTILKHAELAHYHSSVDAELVSRILLYIDEHYTEDISLGRVAEHFGYSQSYVSRYFKACCGITLIRYITLMRLRHAVMLMNSGEHDITYCILESGFSSITTFYRTFHNEFGCSPKEYMKKTKI